MTMQARERETVDQISRYTAGLKESSDNLARTDWDSLYDNARMMMSRHKLECEEAAEEDDVDAEDEYEDACEDMIDKWQRLDQALRRVWEALDEVMA